MRIQMGTPWLADGYRVKLFEDETLKQSAVQPSDKDNFILHSKDDINTYVEYGVGANDAGFSIPLKKTAQRRVKSASSVRLRDRPWNKQVIPRYPPGFVPRSRPASAVPPKSGQFSGTATPRRIKSAGSARTYAEKRSQEAIDDLRKGFTLVNKLYENDYTSRGYNLHPASPAPDYRYFDRHARCYNHTHAHSGTLRDRPQRACEKFLEACGSRAISPTKQYDPHSKAQRYIDYHRPQTAPATRQELQFIPRPSYVYRGHTPHFCNFVQQIPLHKKNGSTTESIGMPDSELDEEMEFITESIEGRLINKWRKNSSSSTFCSSIPDIEEISETSGTEGRPGSPSSVDESEVKSDDGNQKRPVSSVEVKVSTPTKPDTSVKSHTLIRENEPKEDITSYKSDGLSIPEVIDEGGVNDKMGGAWEDNKSNKGDESFRIPSGADDSGNESQRPPSPSRPPPSPEPVVVAPPPEPAPKPARRKSCAKKTKKPVERARKMKEPEVVKEPDPPAVEEVTTPDLPALDSDKAEAPKVELAVPDLPSTTDNKDKSKKEKTKPKRHLIEVEDDLFKQDPTDLLNDQMKYNRVEIDWSGMDMNGMDEVKKAAPIKSWITGRLALSQQASRFELPMDMKLLETMTPQEYVKKHCIISSRRQNLYQKIFMKNKDKTHLILYKDLDRTLKDVLVNTITSDQVKEVLNLLEIDENTRIDNKLFAGLAAFAERVLYPKYVTEDTQDMPEYQKERIECADFCALDWKFHGVNVSPQMSKLLKMIN